MMPLDAQQIVTLLERSLTAADPKAALASLTALRAQLDALERVHVARALEAGDTFTAIGKSLGISRQAAHRRYRDADPRSRGGRAPRFGDQRRGAGGLPALTPRPARAR
jgi:hypothetical protein